LIIGLLIATGWYLYKNWTAFTTGLMEVWKRLGSFMADVFYNLKYILMIIFKSIGNAFIIMINIIIGALNSLIKTLLLPFNLIIAGLNLIPRC